MICIGSQLEKSGDLGRSGKFRVNDLVVALVLPDEEISKALKTLREESGLEDDPPARVKRVEGLLVTHHQPVKIVTLTPLGVRNLCDIAILLPQFFQHLLLVGEPQLRGESQHCVFSGGRLGSYLEYVLELADKRPFAGAGGGEIARGENDRAIG